MSLLIPTTVNSSKSIEHDMHYVLPMLPLKQLYCVKEELKGNSLFKSLSYKHKFQGTKSMNIYFYSNVQTALQNTLYQPYNFSRGFDITIIA